MRIYIKLSVYGYELIEELMFQGLDCELACREFDLNLANQVPHWHYLTNEGISFFKGEKKKDWKNEI